MGHEQYQRILEKIVVQATKRDASDIWLGPDAPPTYSIAGKVYSADGVKPLPAEAAEHFAVNLIPPERRKQFHTQGDYDGQATIGGVRLRVNVARCYGGIFATMRLISAEPPEVTALGLPEPVVELSELRQGLLLVCGETGSGKSTTLAAIINHINRTRAEHIITIEDPIEYVHKHQMSLVHQREVREDGTGDTTSFAQGIRQALRQAPDVILIGEMRDTETVEAAVQAAETGHLVLATLHAGDSVDAVERIIKFFPPGKQEIIRYSLAHAIAGVIVQALVPSLDSPQSRVPICEVMLANPAVRSQIRGNETAQLKSTIQNSSKLGMNTFDAALADAVMQRKISREEALNHVHDLSDFDRRMTSGRTSR